jgi:phage terminase large subunit-like protein
LFAVNENSKFKVLEKRRHTNGIILENEMCLWVPGDPSPNRMDALVWALSELMLKPIFRDFIRVLDGGGDDDDY